jgi:hypothetical protein
MPYQIAGIDVHRKMLAVAVADVEIEDDYHRGAGGRKRDFPDAERLVKRWWPRSSP